MNTGKGFVNGLYANGMGQSGKGYPEGLIDDRGIQFAPRLGIAYQFMPKTVFRAGGCIFYDRLQGNPVFDMLRIRPLRQARSSTTAIWLQFRRLPRASSIHRT